MEQLLIVFSDASEKSSFLHRSFKSGSGKGKKFSRTVFLIFLGDMINLLEDIEEEVKLNKEEKRSFCSRRVFLEESLTNKGENWFIQGLV